MVKIRLRRMGARSKPAYRIVVADSRSPRDGAFIEVIGHYYPLVEPEKFDINKEKALDWLRKGAKPTETVERILAKSGIIERKQRVYQPKSTKAKSEQPGSETNPEAEKSN